MNELKALRQSGSDPSATKWLPLWLMVLVGPYLVNIFWKVMISPRPFWVYFCDPELIYYFNGLRLTRGLWPIYVHSPGTPVVALAAALKLALAGDDLSPERVLVASYIIGLVAALANFWMLLRSTLRGLPPGLVLTAGAFLFLHPAAFLNSAVMSPEMFSLPIGCLLIAAAVRVSERPGDLWALACLGAATGLACAMKMTYAAWIPAAIFLAVASAARSLPAISKTLAMLALGLAGAFVLATLPISPRYGEMLQWYSKVASHAGPYGEGAAGLPSPGLLLERLRALVLSAKAWHLLALSTALSGCWMAWGPKQSLRPGGSRSLLLAFSLAGATGYALYLKHPGTTYLIPVGAAVAGLAVATVRMGPSRMPIWSQALLATVLLLLVVRGSVADLRRHHDWIDWGRESERALDSVLASAGGGSQQQVLLGWRFPSRPFAIGFFAKWGADLNLEKEFRSRFPGFGVYNNSTGERWPTETGRRWDWLVLDAQMVGPLLPPQDAERLRTEASQIGQWLFLRDP